MTVEEALKASGMTDEAIKALDANALQGITRYVSSGIEAEARERQAKEQALAANQRMLSEEINPALDNWANDKAKMEAQVAFYKTQAEAARAGGFIPQDAPNFDPNNPPNPATRGNDGRYVAGGNPVPGSPGLKEFRDGIAMANAAVWDIAHKYRTLFGTEMPDAPSALIAEAERNRVNPVQFAAQKYNFAGKEKEIADAKQKEHDDAIIRDTTAKVTKDLTEKLGGSNPAIRPAVSSEFSKLQKAVDDKQRPDPTMLTREQRHEMTRGNIQREVAENSVQ